VIPGLSLIWVVFFVMLLAWLLDRLFFKPFTRVMSEREQRVKSALDLANRSAESAREAGARFEEQTRAAQGEVYRQMDEARRAALERRGELLGETRREIEASVSSGRARVAEQAESARLELERQSGDLADTIVARVLGRGAS
jgi:F-type H+-transporting ATPase subunit b